MRRRIRKEIEKMEKKTYLSDLANLVKEAENYITRLDSNLLSKSDKNIMMQLAGDYYEMFDSYINREHITDSQRDELKGIQEGIEEFQQSIMEDNTTSTQKAYAILKAVVERNDLQETRQNILTEVFQSDAQEINLHAEKLKRLQELANIDISLFGKLSQETVQVLDVQNCILLDGKVVEKSQEVIMEREDRAKEDIKAILGNDEMSVMSKAHQIIDLVEKDKDVFSQDERNLIVNYAYKTNDMDKVMSLIENMSDDHNKENAEAAARDEISRIDAAKEKEVNKPHRNTEQSYQGSAYMKNNGQKQKPVMVYGNSPEDIITTLQGWNRGRSEGMKLENCYIRKLNPGTNKYENPAKYEVSTGIDITPIYLNLPHMSRDKFLKIVQELKSNGAKYNPVKKAFYITKQNDLNKFAEYLPIIGTQSEAGENRSKEMNYEVEAGQEYYDNRVKVTIEGMESFNVYGDDYGVHFPSLKAEETREILDKFVLPTVMGQDKVKEAPREVEYNGQKYNPLQYDILQMAISQNFTNEQMQLLEHPELTSDRMNEIRFAIKDGLSAEQISKFATPNHEQWQMDFCRIGMQHGFTYNELKDIINPVGYSPEKWGERRNQLAKMIKDRENVSNGPVRPNSGETGTKTVSGEKNSVLTKLGQNKAQIEASNNSVNVEREKKDIMR